MDYERVTERGQALEERYSAELALLSELAESPGATWVAGNWDESDGDGSDAWELQALLTADGEDFLVCATNAQRSGDEQPTLVPHGESSGTWLLTLHTLDGGHTGTRETADTSPGELRSAWAELAEQAAAWAAAPFASAAAVIRAGAESSE